ncbi:MAG: polysaccharide pyruvyl transferase family protein [Opitutae bacterium]|nr:polysaccharide pyruvyl transferase family protein [Opitutae bacterium]
MKVCILSLPLNWNYGGILQQFALQKILKDMGHSVTLLSRRKSRNLIFKALVLFKWGLWVSSLSKIKWLRERIPTLAVECFKRNYLDIAKDSFSGKSLNSLAAEADVFIVGSDQVWNPDACPDLENYFFDFIEQGSRSKKIAYAASFGKDTFEINPKRISKITSLIQDFDAISLREDSGVSILSKTFDITDAEVLPDPVLLLESKVYSSIIGNKAQKKKQLFAYILDQTEEKREFIDSVANTLNLEVYYFLPLKEHAQSKETYSYEKECTVENFLSGFRDSTFVITDSFHGTLFSLIFNVHFLSFGNEERGSTRFENILKKVKLLNRLISPVEDIGQCNDQINWDDVNLVLKTQRELGNNFIKKHIDGIPREI